MRAVTRRRFPSSKTPRRTRRRSARSARRRRSRRSCTRACPVRFWDEDLGPDRSAALHRLAAGGSRLRRSTATGDPRIELTDLTPDAGRALERLEYDVSPDGSTVATTWGVPERGGLRTALAVIDVATGERTAAGRRRGVRVQRAAVQPGRQQPRRRPREALHPARPGRRRVAVVSRRGRVGARPDRRLGPLAGTVRSSGRRTARRAGAHGRRGRPRAGLPDGRRVRRGHPADGRRLRLLRRAGLARRADRLRDAHVVPRAAAARAPRRHHRRPGVRAAARAQRRARASRHAHRGRGDRRGRHPRARRGWRCPRARPPTSPRRCCCGSTAARWARGTPGRWRWNPWLAVGPGVRRTAARPGAVHRLRAGLHRAAAGAAGAARRTPT